MSALLKSDAAAGVRAFGAAPPVRTEAAPAPADPHEAERTAMAAEISRLRKSLADAVTKGEDDAAEALAQGHAAGLAEAEDREADRLAAIGAGVEAAGQALADRLDLLDHLAPQLARAALAKLFGATQSWAPMVEATLVHQLAELRHAAVVAVRVSPLDFADATALDFGSDVTLDPQLAAGACRIELKLGQVDLDVRGQWAKLAALLDAMGTPA